MALVTNIGGAAGATSASSGAPTDTGGVAGLLAALTAIPDSASSSQPTLAANSASGASPVLVQGSAGTSGAEPQKALWAKVFDFYQQASTDAEQTLAVGQALEAASAQAATAQTTATRTAALAGFPSQTGGNAIASGSAATASGTELGNLAATQSELDATEAMPKPHPAAFSGLLDPSASAARAKVISIRVGMAQALDKAHSAAKKETSAMQKGVASSVSASLLHVAATPPPSAAMRDIGLSAQPVPVVLIPVVPTQTASSQSGIEAKSENGLTTGAKATGLAGGLEAASATLPPAIQSGAVQSGAIQSGAVQSGGIQFGAIQSGSMLPGAQVGNTEKLPAVTAQASNLAVELAAKAEAKLAPSLPLTVAPMRLPELADGVRPLPATAAQAAVSSASQAIADLAAKPVPSTTAAQSDPTRSSMTNASVTSSAATNSSSSPSLGAAAAQGQGLSLSTASGSETGSGTGSGHSSASDASAGSKTGAAMHGVTQPSGGAPLAGTWAATMIGHPGESPAAVAGATVSGATSGTASGAALVSATPANGHTAPALHPGQVFESLDAASGAWTPGQSLRTVSGGASLSVGYQDARLGYVELQARQVAGGVQATLVPSSEAARQALEGQLGSLGGWLAQRATPVDRLAVGMPSSMAAMTTDHGGAMNPGGGTNSGAAMDQGRTPNQGLMQSMAQAAQQGLVGEGSGQGSGRGAGRGLGAVGAVGLSGAVGSSGAVAGAGSGPRSSAGYAASTLESGGAEAAIQNEMRVEAARIGVGQTISVRA